MAAARSGSAESVACVLASGVGVDDATDDDLTPLMAAAEAGAAGAVAALLDAGANVNLRHPEVPTGSPCYLADGHDRTGACSGAGGVRGARNAVESVHVRCRVFGPRTSRRGPSWQNMWLPLTHACVHGHSRAAQLLIPATRDLNVRDKDGLAPLAHAARHGHLTIVRMLVRAGARADSTDKVTKLDFIVSD